MPNKVALVTGASSGFGKLIAEKLVGDGFTVYGTSRRERPDTDAGVKMRVLDVTSNVSAQQCVETVLAEAGQIDVLVNNAGIAHSSFVEETPPDIIEAVMQTNFRGVVRMSRAVLPSMRARRSGTIINVSSLAGMLPPPGQAIYAASKHAVEGFSEALRYEVEAFGVHVVLVEPGFFKTDIHHNMSEQDLDTFDDYDGRRGRVKDAIITSIEGGGDPQQVADVVAQIAQDANPKLRYPVGTDAHWLPRLKRLSQQVYAFGLRRKFNLA